MKGGNPADPELINLFAAFHRLQDNYCIKAKYKDCAFAYTEMTNVSLLSTAAIMQGYLALCEYQTLKKHSASDKSVFGRADLYLCDPDEREWIVEAKQLSRRSFNLNNKTGLKAKFDLVQNDVESVILADEADADLGIGIIFVPHYVAIKKDKNESRRVFKSEIRLFANNNSLDFWTYYRPAKVLKNVTDSEHLLGFSCLVKTYDKDSF